MLGGRPGISNGQQNVNKVYTERAIKKIPAVGTGTK